MKTRLAASPPKTVLWGPAVTPNGKVLVGLTPKGEVCRVTYLHGLKPAAQAELWQREWWQTEFTPTRIPEDFATHPLLFIGTPYQKRAWLQILKIPRGETLTYGQVAELIGEPRTARAVGRACRESYLSYIIPFHRVVGANGLGGYGTEGTALKEKLLAAEGIHLRASPKRQKIKL